MPAIGASTTGVSTRRPPSCRPGTMGAGAVVVMRPSALLLRLLRLLRRGGLGRLHRALPLDRVELLAGPVADRGEVTLVGGQVDQAGALLVAGTELVRQRLGRALLERRGEAHRGKQHVVLVDAP